MQCYLQEGIALSFQLFNFSTFTPKKIPLLYIIIIIIYNRYINIIFWLFVFTKKIEKLKSWKVESWKVEDTLYGNSSKYKGSTWVTIWRYSWRIYRCPLLYFSHQLTVWKQKWVVWGCSSFQMGRTMREILKNNMLAWCLTPYFILFCTYLPNQRCVWMFKII